MIFSHVFGTKYIVSGAAHKPKQSQGRAPHLCSIPAVVHFRYFEYVRNEATKSSVHFCKQCDQYSIHSLSLRTHNACTVLPCGISPEIDDSTLRRKYAGLGYIEGAMRRHRESTQPSSW